MTFNKHDFEGKQRFSIRKLSIGVCSVLLPTLLWTMNTSQTVHADTTDPVETEEVESAKKTTTDTGNDRLRQLIRMITILLLKKKLAVPIL